MKNSLLLFLSFLIASVNSKTSLFLQLSPYNQTFFSIKEALLKIDRFDVKVNLKVGNVFSALDNSHDQYTVLNLTVVNNIEKLVVKMKHVFTLSIPENSRDQNYGRVFLKTTVDACRMASIQSNVYVKSLMANFNNFSNFEMKYEKLFV